MKYTFRTKNKIKKFLDFVAVKTQGFKFIKKQFIIFYKKNNNQYFLHNRLGIIVSKKIGNSVIRNKAKRTVREIFRLYNGYIKNVYDVVIIIKKSFIYYSFNILKLILINIFKNINFPLIKYNENY